VPDLIRTTLTLSLNLSPDLPDLPDLTYLIIVLEITRVFEQPSILLYPTKITAEGGSTKESCRQRAGDHRWEAASSSQKSSRKAEV